MNFQEIETNMTPIRVELKCNECDEGTIRRISGVVLASSPPIYPHECTHCDFRIGITGKEYPYTYYIPGINAAGNEFITKKSIELSTYEG